MKEIWKKYREVIAYLIFGVATTAVNWVVYTMCMKVSAQSMTICNAIAWFVAVIFAYATNKVYVFQSKVTGWKGIAAEFTKFLCARGFSGVLEIFLPTILFYVGLSQSFWGIEGFAAKMLTSVLVIIINYVLSKLLIFRKTDGHKKI